MIRGKKEKKNAIQGNGLRIWNLALAFQLSALDDQLMDFSIYDHF